MRVALRLAPLALIAAVSAVTIDGVTAANSVPTSRLGISSVTRTIQQLAPPQCSGITLTSLVIGSGTFAGTTDSDLILGSVGVDLINGGGGDDCIIGGGGIDALTGGLGTDICLATNPLTSLTCEVTHLL